MATKRTKDWYSEALDAFMVDAGHALNLPTDLVENVYQFFMNEGLIDYDIEKDFLWANYVEDEEEYEDC